MNEELNRYKEWNRALWAYFFPENTGNPILYIDEGVLKIVAGKAKIERSPLEGDWGESFLRSTLVAGEQFEYFVNQLRAIPSLSNMNPRPRTWDRLVEHLMKGRFALGVPSYFAMLCSILHLAATCGAVHESMNLGARKYLGLDYRGRFGELADPLLQKLHNDVPSFDQNRMICGTQRHMSRIKFHLVLPRSEKEDFIDFVEINRLKWEWGETSYADFINGVLVPSLSCAGKMDLAQKVTNQEFIPYFKSILQSGLNFDRAESNLGNITQTKDVRWRFNLYFDYSGLPHFYIVSDQVLPFDVEMQENVFVPIPGTPQSDYVSEDAPLRAYQESIFTVDGLNYSFSNVSFGRQDYGHIFFFQATSDESYRQVDVLEEGASYLSFVKDDHLTVPASWELVSDSMGNGFRLYQIDSFSKRQISFSNKRNKLEDKFCRRGLGSWFSLKLVTGQDIVWHPNAVDELSVTITDVYNNESGLAFFRIPVGDPAFLSGTLQVKQGNKVVLSEPIYSVFEWKGTQAEYHLNGWGEIESGEFPENKMPSTQLRKAIIPLAEKLPDSAPDILLQLIYDLADKDGRITTRKMDAAISFALSYHGMTLTPKSKNYILFGLRRLGYIIQHNEDKQVFYQVVSPFLERTNYSFDGVTNIFLVKGTYSQSMLAALTSGPGVIVRRMRPYKDKTREHHPEVCLPDQVLIASRKALPWKTLDRPIAERVLESMEDIRGFATKFGINSGGDIYRGASPADVPGMVTVPHMGEVLCTKDRNGYSIIHPYYEKEGHQVRIPKHLARLFSQVERRVPVCLMSYAKSCGVASVNYASISFVNNMGVPEVLDMALCDLSLVIPSYEKIFILYQRQSLGTPSKVPWTERRTYETHAMTMDHASFLTWLSKLAGKKIDTIECAPESVFVSKTRTDYRLSLTERFMMGKSLMTLYRGDKLVAFALGDSVFFHEIRTGLYKKVDGADVNYSFSEIINKGSIAFGEETYKGRGRGSEIEAISNTVGLPIPIIERVSL